LPPQPPDPSGGPRRERPRKRGIYLFEWVGAGSFLLLALFLVLGPVRPQFYVVTFGSLWLYLRLAALTAVLMAAGVLGRRLGRGWRRALRESELGRPRFWSDLGRIALAMSLLGTAHLLFKLYLPLLNPANYDPALASIDRVLGFGALPVERLAFLSGAPAVLRFFDFVYSGLYFLLVWGGVLLFFVALEGEWRIRFFNGFALLWQGGLLVYFLFPAWGPVFVWPDLVEPLVSHMPATVRLQSALVMETLAVTQGRFNFTAQYFGLAAFPSLHVGIMVLYALWARRVGRFWTGWFACFGGLILIGSVLTGYHYLVDGLAGAALAWGCYRICRPVSGKEPKV